MAETQGLCLLHSCPGSQGTHGGCRNPTSSIFMGCCSQEGDSSLKEVLYERPKDAFGGRLGKFCLTNVMLIEQEEIPLSGSVA